MKMVDFSPAQIEEAEKWYKENYPMLWSMAITVDKEYRGEKVRDALLGTFFDLKVLSIELRPNQFIIGVDYKGTGSAESDMENATLGNIQFNLSFWNPHSKGMADQLAKNFLIAKLSTLK